MAYNFNTCNGLKIMTLRNLISTVIKQRYYLRTTCVFFSTTNSYKENKTKVGKYSINYVTVGNGAHSVLCMPGALGNWTDFKSQVDGFDKEKFRLVVWDAPGYGKSRPPEREFHTDYYGQDADVALEFMKALNITKFSVMGWSYGGASTLKLALKHPQAIHKLVIWATSSFVLPHEIEIYKKIRDVKTWPEKTRRPMIEMYGEERFSRLWAGVVDAMEAEYNGVNGICRDAWKNMSCPTFILYGEQDPLIDKSHVFYLHNNIQKSRIHLYPEGKHNIHIQYAEDFNRRVQEFLTKS